VTKLLRGKIVSSRLGEVIDPWDKFKSAFFNPRNFLPCVKRISWGKKKPDLNLAQGVDDVFSPSRLLTILPQEDWSLFTPEGENK